jgi:hypothetical protein
MDIEKKEKNKSLKSDNDESEKSSKKINETSPKSEKAGKQSDEKIDKKSDEKIDKKSPESKKDNSKDKILIDKKELEELKMKADLTQECLETTLKDTDITTKKKDSEIKELQIKIIILAIVFACFAFFIKSHLPENIQESIHGICNKSTIILIILLIAATYYLELEPNGLIISIGTFIIQMIGAGSSLFKKI